MATLTKPKTWVEPTKKQLVIAALEGETNSSAVLSASELNRQFDQIIMQMDALKYPLEGGEKE